MRNLLALFGALSLTFVIVGYFLGWYNIQNVPTTPGHHKVNIDIDGTKIRQDLNKSGEKFLDWFNNKPSTDSKPPAGPTSSTTPNLPVQPAVTLGAPVDKPAPPSDNGWWLFRNK